jgi:hypothetical protein
MVGLIAATRGEVQAGFGRLDSDAGALKHSKNWALKTAALATQKTEISMSGDECAAVNFDPIDLAFRQASDTRN